MSDSKPVKKSQRWSDIRVAPSTRNMFKDYCKEQGLEMQEAANEILMYMVKNKIPVKSLNDLMDKNITSEIKRYHNYTTGFLQTFEKEQKQLMKNLITNVGGNGAGEGIILRTFMQEILRSVQFLMTQAPDQIKAKIIKEKNEEKLKEFEMGIKK